MDKQDGKQPVALFITGLIILAAAVYWKSLSNGFQPFLDDGDYIGGHPKVRDGLSVGSILWSLTAVYGANWHPVTWMSHMLDISIFGLNPFGHHLTSLIFHALNAALVFLVFLKLSSKRVWPSVFAAALFAVHPINVEPVAYIAARKDLLSTFFFLLGILAYFKYFETRKSADLVKVIALHALALMSKPTVVVLPVLLLLIDYWPLSRFKEGLGRLLGEKAPLLALSVVSVIINFIAQRSAGPVPEAADFSLIARLINAINSYVMYLWNTIWPSKLAPYYPMQVDQIPIAQAAGALAVLILLTLLAFSLRRKAPHVLFGWLWYLIALLPVAGIIHSSGQAMADRYAYIPLMGIYLLFSISIANTIRQDPEETEPSANGWIYGAAAIVILILLSRVTIAQTAYWKDSIRLLERTVEVTKDNYVVQNILGVAYQPVGKLDEAEMAFRESLRVKPDYSKAILNLSSLIITKGKFMEAEQMLQELITREPQNSRAMVNLGNLYAAQTDIKKARQWYEKAAEVNPKDSKALFNLGNIHYALGDSKKAVEFFNRAIEADPLDPQPRNNAAEAYLRLGKKDEAEKLFREGIRIVPEDTLLRINYLKYLDTNNKKEQAIDQARDIARFFYDHAGMQMLAGDYLASQNKLSEAKQAYEKTLELDPEYLTALNNLAYLLATAPDAKIRDGKRAVELAEKLDKLTGGKAPNLLDTLACAYAEAGNYKKAIETLDRAIRIAGNLDNPELVKRLNDRRRVFKSGKPFHYPEGFYGQF